jgi:integrase
MPQYGYKVIYLEPKALAEAGFAHLSDHPFIFDSEPGYARLPNRFLIDRALGHWDPKFRRTNRNPRFPSRVSMRNFAAWLCNALEWAEVRGVDLVTVDYSILINRYQREMLEGKWSVDKRKLKPQTVNARVQIALEYQLWAADNKLREPFIVPTVTKTYKAGSYKSSRSHLGKSVESRVGKVKVNKRTLSMPTPEQIDDWLVRVKEQPVVGPTEGLIAELILYTAIRREEAACWRVDTIPLDPKDWAIINPQAPEEDQKIKVNIQYGCKGRELGRDHGDKIGPDGDIDMPLWLARRIDRYRDKERFLALKNKLKTVKSLPAQKRLKEETVHLFLHPLTGDRYTADQIYGFWSRRVKGPPHWSPHLGRDWWACSLLEQRMEAHKDLLTAVLKNPKLDTEHPLLLALRDTVMTVIQLEIQPQLRHASSDTTEIYLQWYINKHCPPLARKLPRQAQENDEEDDR